jgi:hypothetical protein
MAKHPGLPGISGAFLQCHVKIALRRFFEYRGKAGILFIPGSINKQGSAWLRA